MTFNDLDIIAPILQALNGKGYKTRTSFCDHEEAGYLKSIQKLIGFPVPVLKVPAHLK